MVRIGVASHKDFDDSVLPDCYRVIKVGDVYPSSVARDRGWDLDDDVSPNIHDQNPWYCELTAHYYIWKKWVSEQDVVGLVHYRRLFVDHHRSSNDLADDVLDAESIGEMLRSKKIILPFRSFKRRGQNTLRGGTLIGMKFTKSFPWSRPHTLKHTSKLPKAALRPLATG